MSFLPVWQQSLWKSLLQQWQQQRFPHALLCVGQKGQGKVAFAQRLAKKVLCNQSNETEPCGECRSCHLFQSGSHPDYYSVSLLDKAKQIKVDQIRELSASLSQSAQLNGYQVALISPAETMNRASSNALLKTLEEPPGPVVLILVANELQLPSTILSRCQRLYFNPPQDTLTEPELREQLLKMHWQLLTAERVASSVADELLKQDELEVLEAIFFVWMDVFRAKLQLAESQQKKLILLSQRVDSQKLAIALPELLQTIARLKRSSGLNTQLLLESVLIQWQRLGV